MAEGHTWGYQWHNSSSARRSGKQREKVLYTGSLEIIPFEVDNEHEVTGGIRKLARGLNTTVPAYVLKDTLTTCEREEGLRDLMKSRQLG